MTMVTQVKDASGLEIIALREPLGASAVVHLYGAQITSWKNERGEELLFASSKASFKPPKAIRGGIPICFPQLMNTGTLEQHCFARNRLWSIDPDPPPLPNASSSKGATIDLVFKSTDEDKKLWPHSFELRLRVCLKRGGDLAQTIRVRNTDSKAFSFTFALHTYLTVSDISEVRIEGLETLDYLDNLRERKRYTEQGDSITFDGEVDRVYLGAPTKLAMIDHERKRTVVMKKEGFPDAVVWNPWDKKSRAIPDLGDEDYLHMVCMEPAISETPVTLKPGEEWKGRQELSVVHSSYCSGQLDPSRVLKGV